MKEYIAGIMGMLDDGACWTLAIGGVLALITSRLCRIPAPIRQKIELWLAVLLLLAIWLLPTCAGGMENDFKFGIFIALGVAFSLSAIRQAKGRHRVLPGMLLVLHLGSLALLVLMGF